MPGKFHEKLQNRFLSMSFDLTSYGLVGRCGRFNECPWWNVTCSNFKRYSRPSGRQESGVCVFFLLGNASGEYVTFWRRFLGVFVTRWCLRKSLGRCLHGVVVPPMRPSSNVRSSRSLISFAHLSPSLLILATRFKRGPCIHVAGVCLGIGFWSCHVWGATPCCMLQVRRGETKEGKGRTTQENHKTKH